MTIFAKVKILNYLLTDFEILGKKRVKEEFWSEQIEDKGECIKVFSMNLSFCKLSLSV